MSFRGLCPYFQKNVLQTPECFAYFVRLQSTERGAYVGCRPTVRHERRTGHGKHTFLEWLFADQFLGIFVTSLEQKLEPSK